MAALDSPTRARALAAEKGEDAGWVEVVIEAPWSVVGPVARARAWTVHAAAPHGVQVSVPAESLRLAGALVTGGGRVRAPWRASAKSIVSEGEARVFSEDAWAPAGTDGAGVTVGVLDVGFGGVEDREDELPGGWTLDVSRAPGASRHGTAVAEVIADLAPGAALALVTFVTDVEFVDALGSLVDARVDVVNASIGFDNVWHADGTSPMSVAVDAAVDAGVAYVAAAGNEADKYRIGPLSWVGDGEAVALDGVDGVPVDVAGGWVDVSLRWSEPFGEAREDLDLYVIGADGVACGSSTDWQDGEGRPYERVAAGDCVAPATAHVRAPDRRAQLEGLRAWLYSPYGLELGADTDGTLTLPADAARAISVGAIDVVSGEAPVWASRGPTDDGRLKPDLVAASGVSTVTLGASAFLGSSAAAPHVAGAAALVIDAARRRRHPEDATAVLVTGAADLGVPGPDVQFGWGEARLGAPPDPGCGCAGVRAPSAAALLLAMLLLRRR